MLVKLQKIILSALILCSALSCSKSEDGDLVISLTGSTAFLINTTAQSCSNKLSVFLAPANATPTNDVSAQYFSFPGMTINWKNLTDTAYIVSMNFDFTGSNIDFSGVLSGDELTSMFYDTTNKVSWDGTLAKAGSATAPTVLTTNTLCRITVGGVTVTNKTAFNVSGTVTLRGFQRDADGNEKPIKAKATAHLIYEP